MAVEQKVKQIIVEQLGVDENQVDSTASFVDDLGADSLDIVELARAVDPDAPFAAALLLWSAWHGIVSLRLHKNEWDWGMTAAQANRRMVAALTATQGSLERSDGPRPRQMRPDP